MENFKNVSKRWQDVPWDPNRHYSAPWQWGTTGVSVNKTTYSGDINTSAIFMDPPEELVGKVNVIPEMSDVMAMAVWYAGGGVCTENKTVLKKVRNLLVAAKPKWLSMNYGMTEKMSNNDVLTSVNWSGSSYRVRLKNPDVAYGYHRKAIR